MPDNSISSVTDLLPEAEAARRLNNTIKTLRLYRCQKKGAGRIPCARMGRRVFYRASDIAEYITALFEQPKRGKRLI